MLGRHAQSRSRHPAATLVVQERAERDAALFLTVLFFFCASAAGCLIREDECANFVHFTREFLFTLLNAGERELNCCVHHHPRLFHLRLLFLWGLWRTLFACFPETISLRYAGKQLIAPLNWSLFRPPFLFSALSLLAHVVYFSHFLSFK